MPNAERSLERLPRVVRRRADKKIVELANDPRPPGCVKLSGHDDRRIVIVLIVAHRRDVYRGL